MDVSIVLPTYNRCTTLRSALEKFLVQAVSGIEYEIVVVDNNSPDHTREAVASFVEKDSRFRYILETRQGVSYARNAGVRAAQADLIVFCDDDVQVDPSWIQKNYEAARRFPQAAYIGGRILPIWEAPPPLWAQWSMSPFALSDLGDEPVVVCPKNKQCLVTASLAVPRRTFQQVGMFDAETQKVKNAPCSTEDFEWEKKIWACGGHGVYVPDILCYTLIPEERVRKSYHRRWHFCHGKLNAISRTSDFEGSRCFLGVALFVYRLTLEAGLKLIRDLFRSDARAFADETQLWFLLGFMRQRWKDHFSNPDKRRPANATPFRPAT